MNILSVENCTKSYGEKVLFDNISFIIGERQRIGLIGINGTGKSSLLKIIAGLESPDQGKLIHANQFRVEYLSQNPVYTQESTVLEHVFYGDAPLMKVIRAYEQVQNEFALDPTNEKIQARVYEIQHQMDLLQAWDAETNAQIILTKLGITEFNKPVNQLSGGQRKRVALATALIQPADLLILDEPTNHIDNDTVEWLESYLSKYSGALLMVTHDRYFLDRVTNRIMEINHGKLYSYEGNYEVYLEKKAEREERDASSEDKRQNLLRRELAWLHRGAKARTTKQKARIDRAEQLRDQKIDGPGEAMDMAVGASRLGRKVLELKEVNKSFENKTIVKDLSYIVMPRDRLGIIGPNGSGKSTLLNLLAGRLQPDSGTIEVGTTVKMAYYTQENMEMDDKLRVLEYIKQVAEVIRTAEGETVTAAQMLERFLFPANLQWTHIGRLSGGERRRLYLLRTLMGEPNVLFLDEPTNDLDIQTLTILEDYLERFPGAVITVSHDRYFLDRTVEHLFAFEGEGAIVRFDGNYSDYLHMKRVDKELKVTTSTTIASHPISPAASKISTTIEAKERPSKLSFKEQKEWNEIEGTIASLEAKIADLKREITLYSSDSSKVQKLYEKEQYVATELEQAMERWSELSLRVEQIESYSQSK